MDDLESNGRNTIKYPYETADILNARTWMEKYRESESAAEVKEGPTVGLPLPSFAPRYLFRKTVFPFGKLTLVSGRPGTGKTSLIFELLRWFISSQGGGTYIFAEGGRFNPHWKNCIIGKALIDLGALAIRRAESLEGWQRIFSSWIDRFDHDFKEAGGVSFASCVALDSITGAINESATKSIDDEGCAKLMFGADAKLIGQYIKWFTQRMYSWPISFVAAGHTKVNINDGLGGKTEYVPGGRDIEYYMSSHIRLKKLGTIERQSVMDGQRVSLEMLKNSDGATGRKIFVELISQIDKNGVEVGYWDWLSASIELLAIGTTLNPAEKKIVEEVLPFESTNPTHRTVTCKKLGLTKPTRFAEAGAVLESNQEILGELYRRMGIQPCREFEEGMPFNEQLDRAATEEAALAAAANTLDTVAEVAPAPDVIDAAEAESAKPARKGVRRRRS